MCPVITSNTIEAVEEAPGAAAAAPEAAPVGAGNVRGAMEEARGVEAVGGMGGGGAVAAGAVE